MIPQEVIDATLEAFVQSGGNATRAARLLCVHENTVKYRLDVVRKRWRLSAATHGALLAACVRAGYGEPDDFDSARAFALWLLTAAGREPSRHYGLAIRLWLQERLEEWEQLRAGRTAA